MIHKLQLLPVCVAALALSAPVPASAAPKASPSSASSAAASPAASKKAASPAAKDQMERTVPFHGMISTVDQAAKTFTIAGKDKPRVFKVTEATVLTKAGAVATMKDIVANEEVRGNYRKAADGSLEAKTVKLGPKTDAEKAGSKNSTKKAKSEASSNASSAASPNASPSAKP